MNTLTKIRAEFDSGEPFDAFWYPGDYWNGWVNCYVTPETRDAIADEMFTDSDKETECNMCPNKGYDNAGTVCRRCYRGVMEDSGYSEFMNIPTDDNGLVSLNGYCVMERSLNK